VLRTRSRSPSTTPPPPPSLSLPLLRPDQTAIVRHPARLKCLAMGRRWGKTLMAGSLALQCARRGAAVAWVVPTYKNARPVWRFLESRVRPLAPRVVLNRADRTAEFPSGGWVGVYSADNDVGLRGEAFDLVIVDEAAQVAEATYTDVILPTLADRDGRCLLISTPRGRDWFWREWTAALADGTDRAAWTAPSSANPVPAIQRAAALAASRVPERTYRQEWLAEFVEDGGGVIRNVRRQATAVRQDRAMDGHAYRFGVDWGRTTDATAIAVYDTTIAACVALDRFTDTAYAVQVGRLKGLVERFRPTTVVAERNGMGEPLVELLQRERVPVKPFLTTNQSKADLIDALALAFETGAITIPDDPILVAELEAYEAARLPSGLLRYGAPAGLHDDCVTALALAVGVEARRWVPL
jgi:Terminase large subunit, T4likevirus-type, N-terminal/Terminase RNaseH-like domain